ncbi:MAG: hypothetical protein WBE72_02085 [Terracidiphilus sp.]
MQVFRSARWLLLALLVFVIPASSHAQLLITVNFAPPELPVYVQPMCPQPNLMWTPGYWAYGDGGYFWVPGAWVPAPYEGALWTPGYWSWNNGNYAYNNGYWGPHVGYYGGVNYGGGYLGEGFAGGEWRGGNFAYNTAVVNVNRTYVHTTYANRTIIETDTVANPHHAAFSGGPDGVQHQASAVELVARHDPHVAPTSFQVQHVTTARADKASFAKANGGHPKMLVAAKPLAVERHAAPAGLKTEAKTAPKAEEKTAPKAEEKTASRPEARTAPKTEARAEPKPEVRAAPKPVSHAAPKPEPEAKEKQ